MAGSVDDSETDPGYRSRSQSRRARRKKASGQQKQMPPLPEDPSAQAAAQGAPTGPEAHSEAYAEHLRSMDPQQAAQQPGAMQPFEFIGNDSTSMNGPVTYARAMRGEIPMRPGNPNQSLATGVGDGAKQSGGSDLMDQDGLKLRLDLNLDVEVELKAKIYGDLTIALLT